jgi:hypothetical protein
MQLRNTPKQYTIGDNFDELNKLFFKYFKIPEELESISKKYDLSNSLGIHFRGTDKTCDTIMNTSITIDEFYVIIDSYLKNNKNITSIFLATDEKNILEYLKEKYKDIVFITSRNFSENLFWKNNKNVLNNGKEAMIDMLCLSKCKIVLKVSSALSAFSKLINPKLNIYRLNAVKMFADIPYFPDAYIPLLEKNNNYTEECNLILDKIQLNDWSIKNKENFNNFCYKQR